MAFIRNLLMIKPSGIRSLMTSGVRTSDALFVHRDKDPDAEKFEFTPENKKVCFEHSSSSVMNFPV